MKAERTRNDLRVPESRIIIRDFQHQNECGKPIIQPELNQERYDTCGVSRFADTTPLPFARRHTFASSGPGRPVRYRIIAIAETILFTPVGSAEEWVCGWIVRLHVRTIGLACIHMRCTDTVDRVRGRRYSFPAKDVDVASSSFANKRFCFVLLGCSIWRYAVNLEQWFGRRSLYRRLNFEMQ